MILLSGCSNSEQAADPTISSASKPAGPSPSAADSAAAKPGECVYAPTPGQAPAKPVEPPTADSSAATTGTITLKTNNGDIKLTLDPAAAPCTTRSMLHLAAAKYYDGSPCHRLVASDNFKILQCGDPSGTGRGGPGYRIPDEKPANLKPAPTGSGSVYPRGVVAMANSGQPDSGGSQFFLVFGDTFLPPDYTVFGTIDEAGLAVLDTIGAAGDDGSMDSGPGGGAPAMATTITQAVIG